jgi:hypothetical protein
MNSIAARNFLEREYLPLLRQLSPDTKPLFGKMNVQQMIEHMTDSIAIASERLSQPHQQSEELTEKMRNFMLSDKPFRENTPNAFLPDDPPMPRNATIEGSISALENEIHDFIQHFENQAGKRVMNPFFGALNFDEWLHLFHKHALHHLRQFGISTF